MKAWMLMGMIVGVSSVAAQPPTSSDTIPPPSPIAPTPAVVLPSETGRDPLQRFEKFSDAIFLLYNELDKFQDPNWIIIPSERWDDFLKEEMAKRSAPGDAWTITDFSLKGTLGEPHARLQATVTIRAGTPTAADFRPVEVNLQMQEAFCQNAKSDSGEQPSLRKEDGGPFLLTIDKPGVHTYHLELFAEIDRTPADERLQLTLPSSGVKSVELQSEAPLVMARDGKTGKEVAISADQKSLRPDLRPEDSLNLLWRMAADRETGSDNSFTVVGTLSYRLDEEQVETEAILNVDARTDSRDWTFRLPVGERLRGVTADRGGVSLSLQSEVVTTQENFSLLKIHFAEPVSSGVQLRILSDRPRPTSGGPLEVGRCEMLHAESQTGSILVFTAADLWIRFTPKRGLQRVAVAQLDPALQRAQPHRAFRYSTQPASLELEVENARPILTASSATDVQVVVDSAEIQTRLRFSIRQAHTEKLALRIPIEMSDLQVSPRELVEVESIRPNPQTGVSDVVLNLSEPTIGDVNISLQGMVPLKPEGTQILRVPLPSEDIEYSGTVAVRAAPNVRINFEPDQTKNLRREPIPAMEEAQTEPLWFFRHQRGLAELAFSLNRLPRQIEAAVTSEFRRGDGGLLVKSIFRFRAKHEPMEKVSLRIPPGIREVNVDGDKMSDTSIASAGVVSLPLTNPVDRCEVRVEYQISLDPGALEARVPLVLPVEASLTSYKGEVRCEAGVRAVAGPPWETGQPTRDVATSDPPSLVIGSRSPPEVLDLRFESTGSLAAVVVPRVLVEEVMTEEGQRLGRVRMLVARHRTRAVVVRVPVDCKLTEIQVDGEPAPHQALADGGWQVRLPLGDRACSLEVGYAFTGRRTLGVLDRTLLEVPSLDEDIAVGEVHWVIRTNPNRLLINLNTGEYSDLVWRFRGVLFSPRTPDPASVGLDWLHAGDASLRWGAPLLSTRESTAGTERTWAFEQRGHTGRLDLVRVREPFWLLVCSGLVLVAGFAISRASGARQLRVGGVALGGAILLAAIAPEWGAWIWLGAQWGVYMVVTALALSAILARRRRLRFAMGGRSTVTKDLSFSASSLLRKLQSQPVESSRPIGSTIDVK
ncbi:MAG: hypothetical protein U1D30_12585 [Planctomycetota bacterium]